MSSDAPTDETPLKAESTESASESKEEDASPKYKYIPGFSKVTQDVKEASVNSPNKAVFLLKFFEIVSGSALFLLCTLIFQVVPIAMIIIGSVYLHECDRQPHIPVWLVVFGCFSLLQALINSARRITKCFRKDRDEHESTVGQCASRIGGCCECLIYVFLFAWLIAGTVWVFGFYPEFNSSYCQENASECCSPVVFWLSVVVIVLIYSMLLMMFILCGCTFCIVACAYGIAWCLGNRE